MLTWTLLMAVLLAPQDAALDRAARTAESFWEQFTSVQAKERVVQTKLRPDGKVIVTHSADFDYVAFIKLTGRGLEVEESRVSRMKGQTEERESLLISSGFPAFLLMFHPAFRDRFEFTESGSRLNFKSKSEAQSLSALKLRDHIYPIRWSGTATLDASGAVRRIEASLDAPMDDLGLADLHLEIDYGPTTLSGATFWLPQRAVISAKSQHQAWRNVHEFSEYKRFSVTTSTRDEALK